MNDWSKLQESSMDPLDWGWKMKNDILIPIMTDQVQTHALEFFHNMLLGNSSARSVEDSKMQLQNDI